MTVTWLLLALAALDLNRECGYFCRDPVTIAHPLCKPSVRDVYDLCNSIGSTINIPEVCWRAPTVAGACSSGARVCAHGARLPALGLAI